MQYTIKEGHHWPTRPRLRMHGPILVGAEWRMRFHEDCHYLEDDPQDRDDAWNKGPGFSTDPLWANRLRIAHRPYKEGKVKKIWLGVYINEWWKRVRYQDKNIDLGAWDYGQWIHAQIVHMWDQHEVAFKTFQVHPEPWIGKNGEQYRILTGQTACGPFPYSHFPMPGWYANPYHGGPLVAARTHHIDIEIVSRVYAWNR